MMGKKSFAQISFHALLCCVSVCVLASCQSSPRQREVAAAPLATDDVRAALSAQKVIDGSIVLLNLDLPADVKFEDVHAEFEGVTLPFYPVPERGERAYQAIFGIPINHKPGFAVVNVKVESEKETQKAIPLNFFIADGQYRSEKLRVDPRQINPRKKDIIRIRRDSAEVGKIYRQITRQKFWKGPFVLPVNNPISSVYGTKRVYNGKLQSFHQGIDLKAKIGTPVLASAPGLVVLAKDLFFTGWTVLLDHGYGVFTVYGHMSKLKVKKGQKVEAGTVVGLSGMTGRSSGPHLHWGAVVHRVKVNPSELTRGMQ